MRASEPGELTKLFLEALNAGDVEAMVSLYEPDGVIAPERDRVISGQSAIRDMGNRFLAEKPRFTLHDTEVVQMGDVALVRSRWTIATKRAAGGVDERHLAPSLVVRRQPEGHWLVVIDRPLPAS